MFWKILQGLLDSLLEQKSISLW